MVAADRAELKGGAAVILTSLFVVDSTVCSAVQVFMLYSCFFKIYIVHIVHGGVVVMGQKRDEA